jgi:hypothetical protein
MELLAAEAAAAVAAARAEIVAVKAEDLYHLVQAAVAQDVMLAQAAMLL